MIWKNILGYEGLYQVSDTGLVKACKRSVPNKHGKLQHYPERLLKFDITSHTNTSYARVTLCKDHKTKKFSVHRLVACAFLAQGRQDQVDVNHIDNNGMNNCPSNLEWCSHSENMLHAQMQGRLFKAQSKAGKQCAANADIRIKSEVTKLQGSSINAWTVNSYAEYRAKKHYVNCTCKCGKEQSIELGRLRRKEVTSCRSCAKT